MEPDQLTLYPNFFQILDFRNFADLDFPEIPIIVVKKIITAPIIPPAIPAIKEFIIITSAMFVLVKGDI